MYKLTFITQMIQDGDVVNKLITLTYHSERACDAYAELNNIKYYTIEVS